MSHCSGPAAPVGVKCLLTLPSPHCGIEQSSLQVCDSGEVTACELAGCTVADAQASVCVPSVLRTPSPQRLTTQSLRQSSALLELPSSHSSPWSTTPLPQLGSVQMFEQPSESILLPSSQASRRLGPRVLWSASPHRLIWQCAVQSRSSASSELPEPSIASHCSGPV